MKKANILIIAGLLVMAAAIIAAGLAVFRDAKAGTEADEILSLLAPKIGSTSAALSEEETADGDRWDFIQEETEAKAMPIEKIAGFDTIGVLKIPTREKELPILYNLNNANLERAPCRYVGSSYAEDLVICGHNYTGHFGTLKKLNIGDIITFTDVEGTVFTYTVKETETLKPTAVEEMTTGDWALTLFTCTPGGAARFAVRCELSGIS